MTKSTYRDAGVDLDLYQQSMDRLPELMRRTHSARVIDQPGGFAGLFRLLGDGHRYEDPVLVSGTDGVGTKLKVAQMVGRFNTVGIDLVAMCINDCLCLGAEPLFFLDYLALGKDEPDLVADLVEGVSTGCERAGAALLGGETAIMPGLYQPGDFDMAGFCVGVVERTRIIDGSRIAAGDILIGVSSSGFHSNGFSLLRKVLFEVRQFEIDYTISECESTLGEAILEPTRIYASTVADVMRLSDASAIVHGMAHITGGGLQENIQRILPAGMKVRLDQSAWDRPPIIRWFESLGDVEEEEMFRVFNMGIGYVFVVDAEHAETILATVSAHHPAWVIGKIVASE